MEKKITCFSAYVILGIISMATVAEAGVTIISDFPGGNVIVKSNEGDTVQIAPDLRGGRSWFYWNFEATADKPGKVTFEGGQIGGQGPAISLDSGKTWKYTGADNVENGNFFYNFDKAGQKVRFAVTMPYLQSDLDVLLKESEGNPHLAKSILTKSKKGRDVELLQIGQPGGDKKAVLFTARHHACESIASYVMEGFLKTAISDTPEAVGFRKNYVLYVVPFVDKDGVEEGDQGKNRAPHDHNRDYGPNSIHPEIDAIEKLGAEKNIRFVMDWHCPTLNMSDHQNFYFDGPKNLPVRNMANVSAFAGLIKSEFPSGAPGGPFNWMNTRGASTMCTTYFSVQPKMIMSTAFEVPYSPRGRKMDPDSCRLYGAAILRAWMKMDFQYEPEYSLTVNGGTCEGDGDYIKGTVVNVTADLPPAGQVFDIWTGDTSVVSNVYDATPTVTMPAAEVTLRATYKQPGELYVLNVTTGTGSGSYSENAVVDLVSDEPAEGQEFVAWVGDTDCLVDPKKPVTSITMPTKNVTVTATYKKATLHMMAYWEMEETEGDVVHDSTGNGYDLVPVDGMKISDATTAGKLGNGYALKGTGQRFTQATLLDVMPEKLTIVGWVKPENGGGCWFSKQNNSGEQLWLKFNMDRGGPGIIGSSFRSDGEFYNCDTNVKWVSGNWYHYVFTWDSAGCQIYVDGELKGRNPTPIMGNGNNIDLTIGSGGLKSAPFKGVVDDVRVCEDVLNAKEIADLYNRIP